MDDLSDVRDLYNGAWDVEADRLARHQLEADLTWRYIDECVSEASNVLEVGFGTGYYTFGLARRGHRVTAIDLSDEFARRCQSMAEKLGFAESINFQVGDARQMDAVESEEFDAVLLMGPLYHLVLEEDRLRALREAFRCLRPGGIILSSLISRFAVLADQIKKNPNWIDDQERVWSHIREGHRPDYVPRVGFRGYFVRTDEIAPLHQSAGFEMVKMAGVEPVISTDDESYNQLEGKRRELWLDLLYHVSGEESMIAGSRHILYVGRRPAT